MSSMPAGIYCFLIVLLCLAPPAWAFAVLFRSRRIRRSRRPIRSHIIRGAGTTLFARISERSDWMMMMMPLAAAIPLAVAVAVTQPNSFFERVSNDVALKGFLWAVALAIPMGCAVLLMARKLARDRDDYHGERMVAEHLRDLGRAGCYVFHDLAPEGAWNIDHIVVTPEAVLVIESVFRRPGRAREMEVVFDGTMLWFPDGTDAEALERAKRSAEYLRAFLSEAMCEPVKVEAVVALPGWMVRRKGRGEVLVVNPKEIRALARTRGARGAHLGSCISAETGEKMGQIAFALDLKCRDAEE